MNLFSTKDLTSVLQKNDFFFKKNLGQNFLINESIAQRIANASKTESVSPSLCIEIGPGAGSLTSKLSLIYDKVIAIEIDKHLFSVLEETLVGYENIEIINHDALKFDISKISEMYPGHNVFVCSNLPYYITSEIIMKLLESSLKIKAITVMIQKEAATRLCAKPGSPDYGSICVAISYFADVKKLFDVGPGNFIPRPKVSSSVISITPLTQKRVNPKDEKLFFQIVRSSFASRRKTILNALSNLFGVDTDKALIEKSLNQAGIDPLRRGETLCIDEFSLLSDEIFINFNLGV